MIKSSKIVILGAGLSGLSTAYHLQEIMASQSASGGPLNYEIFEQELTVGGLCRSVTQDGFTFDYTGHLLHLRENYTKNLVKKLLNENYQINKRNSRIYSKGVYTLYPFQANTYGLPPKIVKDCVLGFIKAKCQTSRKNLPIFSPRMNKSFYEWIILTFGKGIARHFMVPYNEKLWTVHPRKLTCDWIHSLVPQPSLKEVITGAFSAQRKSFGYNAVFWYPKKGGIQVLADAFACYIKNLNLNSKIIKVDIFNKLVQINNNCWYKFNNLVSTLPLKQFIKLIDKTPQEVKEATEALKCNSVLNINFGIERPHISDKHWIYFPERQFIFYRVGFPMNFSSSLAPKGKSSIYTEVAYNQEAKRQMPYVDDYRMPEDRAKIIERVKKDLIKIGILKPTDKILTINVLDVKNAYVIYDKNRTKSLAIINQFLVKNNIYSIGRYGSWKYLTMEDEILEGKQTAEALIGSRVK